jgi:uncharacterized membrane protein YkvA (DUF1232 family)
VLFFDHASGEVITNKPRNCRCNLRRLCTNTISARVWAGFIPDCVIFFKRLLGDPMVPRGSKFWLGGLILYLAMPIDLVPDFVPIAGQLDDAIIVALVLRLVLRRAGEVPIRQHWPGPQSSPGGWWRRLLCGG